MRCVLRLINEEFEMEIAAILAGNGLGSIRLIHIQDEHPLSHRRLLFHQPQGSLAMPMHISSNIDMDSSNTTIV